MARDSQQHFHRRDEERVARTGRKQAGGTPWPPCCPQGSLKLSSSPEEGLRRTEAPEEGLHGLDPEAENISRDGGENCVYLPILLHALPWSPGLGGRVPILLLAFLSCWGPFCPLVLVTSLWGGDSGHFLGSGHFGQTHRAVACTCPCRPSPPVVPKVAVGGIEVQWPGLGFSPLTRTLVQVSQLSGQPGPPLSICCL